MTDFRSKGDQGGESLAAAMNRADALRPPAPPPVRIVSYAEFLRGFTPPDYLVFGMLQRGFLYALTAQSGAGKTAAALLLARIAGSVSAGALFAGREVEIGNVLSLCAENPDDIRMRLIGMDSLEPAPAGHRPIWFDPVRRPIADMIDELAAQAPPHGFQLVIVDTSTAYFPGLDENANVEAGDHARTLPPHRPPRPSHRPRPLPPAKSRGIPPRPHPPRRRRFQQRDRRQPHPLEARRRGHRHPPPPQNARPRLRGRRVQT